MKVNAEATPSQFLIAASAGDCNAAMAALLGMMVSAGGLASTPTALLATHSQVNDWSCLASYHLLQVQLVHLLSTVTTYCRLMFCTITLLLLVERLVLHCI